MCNPPETSLLCHCWLRSLIVIAAALPNFTEQNPDSFHTIYSPQEPLIVAAGDGPIPPPTTTLANSNCIPAVPHPQRWLLQFFQRLHQRAC